MDFLKSQFDKLLLAALVLTFAALSVHAFHRPADESALATFATDQAKLFAGALLTLITGHIVSAMRGGGSPPGRATTGEPEVDPGADSRIQADRTAIVGPSPEALAKGDPAQP